jgi:hypothetical protein
MAGPGIVRPDGAANQQEAVGVGSYQHGHRCPDERTAAGIRPGLMLSQTLAEAEKLGVQCGWV